MYLPLFLLLCLKLALALAGREEPHRDVYRDLMTWLFERHWNVEKHMGTSTRTSWALELGSRGWKRDIGQTACRAARNSIWPALHRTSLIVQSFIVTIPDSGVFFNNSFISIINRPVYNSVYWGTISPYVNIVPLSACHSRTLILWLHPQLLRHRFLLHMMTLAVFILGICCFYVIGGSG